MKRLIICCTILLAACGQPKPALHVFAWSEYFDPKIFSEFEQRFNCRVTVDFFEDSDSMLAKLVAGGSSLYDVIVPSDTILPVLVNRGLLAPLRHENIPNVRWIEPQFTNAPYDPGLRYSVPCDWGITGLYLRKTKGQVPEPTWGLIFDPAKQPGPILLMEDVRTCLGAALRYKGYSLNSTDPKHLTEARDLLLQTKKRSLGFEGATGCKNSVLAKRATLAVAYNGDANRGMSDDAETVFVIPREGSQLWLDLLSIPAQAPHRDLAEKFINYVLEPKTSALHANFSQLATPNTGARQFIRPADLNNPTIYPPPEVMARLEYGHDLGEKNALYDELWTEIKSK